MRNLEYDELCQMANETREWLESSDFILATQPIYEETTKHGRNGYPIRLEFIAESSYRGEKFRYSCYIRWFGTDFIQLSISTNDFYLVHTHYIFENHTNLSLFIYYLFEIGDRLSANRISVKGKRK